jgi:hypothetical protein
MQITMTSTAHITELDGIPVRLWEGETLMGTKCKVFVHRIAVSNDEDSSQFEQELKEQLEPGRKIPLRNIL